MSPTSYRTALPRDIAFRSQRRIYYSTDSPILSIENFLFFVKFADSARFQLLPRWFAAVNAPKTRAAGFGSAPNESKGFAAAGRNSASPRSDCYGQYDRRETTFLQP